LVCGLASQNKLERQAASGKRQAASGKRQAASGKRQAASGKRISVRLALKKTVKSLLLFCFCFA